MFLIQEGLPQAEAVGVLLIEEDDLFEESGRPLCSAMLCRAVELRVHLVVFITCRVLDPIYAVSTEQH